MPAFAPTRLFTGDAIIEGATIEVTDGRIVDVDRKPKTGATKLDGLLAPGFIDVQVNGGGGVLFNDITTAEALATITAAHRQFGVTSLMATLVSDDRAKIAKAFDAMDEAHRKGVEGLAGIHLEGPWLSEPKRGVHPAHFLRPLDKEDLDLITRKRPYKVMVTVAPERIDTASLKALAAAGVIINIGHTAASSEDVKTALAAGARGFTHLFNAMPPLEARKPGAVGAALAHREAWAGLILDGIHVHPTSARVAFLAKTARKLILVSDAMSTVGSETPSMSLFGETITVRDGALRTADGTLAGAHLDLSHAVRNAVALLGASPEEALRMASLSPAEFVGIENDRGRIAPGARADFVLLNDALEVKSVWVGERQTH